MKERLKSRLNALAGPAFAMILAFIFGAIVIYLSNENPLHVYAVLLKGAFGSWQSIAGSLLQATPIIIAGIAACLAFKAGVFNIGVEGQLYLGGFAAALVGFSFELPAIIHLPLAMLASILAGMLWIFIPAYFRSKYNTNEVVATILLNYVAVLFTSYLTIFVFKLPGGWSETPQIYPSAYLPQIFSFSRLNYGFFIAIILAVALKLYLKRTASGYETVILGSNPKFAEYGGVNINKKVFTIMLISGAIAGFAGGIETLGVHHRFMEGFAPGFGFDGLTAAMLVNADPIGTVFAAVFFGALRAGSLLMEVETSISREVVTVIQAVIILFVSAKFVFTKKKAKNNKEVGD